MKWQMDRIFKKYLYKLENFQNECFHLIYNQSIFPFILFKSNRMKSESLNLRQIIST